MKQPILLLHGALGSEQQFATLKKLLQDQFAVHTLNFAGHGGMAIPSAYSMQLFAENVIDFLDQASIGQISIFGYSMGGYVALKAALQHPERIGKILTLGTKFNWTPTSAAKEVRFLDPQKVEEKVPRFAEKLRQEHHPADWKLVMERTAGMMLDLGNDAALREEDFRQISQEVCIGIGELDNMVTLEESEQVAAWLPHGRLKQLAGVKHPIDQVDPQVVQQYLEEVFA
jgi:pimeloyl-ACP methyl ester carboxylesterase